jgi:hypothetical protein
MPIWGWRMTDVMCVPGLTRDLLVGVGSIEFWGGVNA